MKLWLLTLLGVAFAARSLPDCPKGISKKKPSSSYCRCPAGSYIRAERQRVRSGRYHTASNKVGFYCKSNKRHKTKRAACPKSATKSNPASSMCSCPKVDADGKKYVLHVVRTKSSGGRQGGRGGRGGRQQGGRGGYSQGGRGGYSQGGRGGYSPSRGGRGQQQRGGSQGGYNPYQRGGSSRGGYSRGGQQQGHGRGLQSGYGQQSRGGSQQGYPSRGGRGSSRGSRGGYGGRGSSSRGSRGGYGGRGGRGQTSRGGRGGRRGGRGGRGGRKGKYGFYCAELKQCSAKATSSKTAVSSACFCAKGQRLRRVFATVKCPQKQNSGRGGRRGGRGQQQGGRGGRMGGRGQQQGGRGQQQGGRGGYGRGGNQQQGGRGGYNPYSRGGSSGRGQQQRTRGGGRGLLMSRGQQRGGQQGGSRGGYNPYGQQGGRGQQQGGRGGYPQQGGRGSSRGSRGGYNGRGQQGGRGSSRGGRGGRGSSRGGRGGRGGRRQRSCRKSTYYCQTIKACPSTATSAAKGTPNYCKCSKGRLMRHMTRSRSRYSRRSSNKAVYYCSTAKTCPAGVSSNFSCICKTGKKSYKRLAGTSSSRARFGVYCRTSGSSGSKPKKQKHSWCYSLHYEDECSRSRGCEWDTKDRRCSAGFSGDQKKYHQRPQPRAAGNGGN